MSMEGNLILCGFMGCGKSTVGRELSRLTGKKFLDLDSYVEQREGRTIPEIFDREGEPGFRAAEARAVQALSQETGLIIAAGGGTLLFPGNAAAFRARGVIVLLDAPLAAIQERLRNDTSRPLIQKPNRNEVIRELYEKRLPAYREAADVTVDAGAPAREVARRVLAALDPDC